MTTLVDDIETAARRLADVNAETEPNVQEIYLFPAVDEIRLVEVDASSLPNKQMTPFYFGPDPVGSIPFRSAIVLIRPEETHLSPPHGWGTWASAVRIWPHG